MIYNHGTLRQKNLGLSVKRGFRDHLAQGFLTWGLWTKKKILGSCILAELASSYFMYLKTFWKKLHQTAKGMDTKMVKNPWTSWTPLYGCMPGNGRQEAWCDLLSSMVNKQQNRRHQLQVQLLLHKGLWDIDLYHNTVLSRAQDERAKTPKVDSLE